MKEIHFSLFFTHFQVGTVLSNPCTSSPFLNGEEKNDNREDCQESEKKSYVHTTLKWPIETELIHPFWITQLSCVNIMGSETCHFEIVSCQFWRGNNTGTTKNDLRLPQAWAKDEKTILKDQKSKEIGQEFHTLIKY